MCLILFSWDNHPKYKLILAANRDEFYKRPTNGLHQWANDPNILAGKDLTGGGTWMGINRENRFSAITNHRNPNRVLENAPSRGDLTMDFLVGKESEKKYFDEKKETLDDYNGFNLLVGSLDKMGYFNNVNNEYQELSGGIYGLSNATLNTQWPKLIKAKSDFTALVKNEELNENDFFQILQNKSLASDDELPKTGVPYDWEKAISAICIETPTYGTCCSTFIIVTHEGKGEIMEYSFPVGGRKEEIKKIPFDWSSYK